MRPLLLIALLGLAAPLAAETCPPPPDLGARKDALLAELKVAPDEQSARLASNRLWEIWTAAPDDRAQQLLDTGIERRGIYDFEAAEAAFSALVAYCPEYAEGYNQRAFIHFLRQDFEAALPDLDRALEITPDHVAALSGRALTLIGLGRMDEAQTTLRQALALNPWLAERSLLIAPEGDEI